MNKALEQNLTDLEAVMRAQLAQHERILALLHRKRQALAAADAEGVAQCSVEENRHVQALGELEKRRLLLVGEITLGLDPAAPAPLGLPELAQRLPEPARGRLLVLRVQLRERMEAVAREVGVARRATETLVRHMHGLIQTIGGALTGIGTYTRAGGRPKAALAVSTFNVKA
jgi:hypothetical protein